MAKIVNPFAELVENHTTEEVLAVLEAQLSLSVTLANKGQKEQSITRYVASACGVERALGLLRALNNRLGVDPDQGFVA